ncbi:MAG TPA: hypothetical protein VMU34_22080 [Mycobacterium sp.]|nr:hypothetical protein [Mycobacterium sp.]
MASQSVGPGSAVPSSEWNSSPRFYTRAQLTTALRAALIALVLLAALAYIAWF